MMAYFVGWEVTEMEVILQDDKLFHGRCAYGYRGDEQHNELIKQRPQLFYELNPDQKARVIGVAEGRIQSLFGGPAAQWYFENGIDSTLGQPDLREGTPDNDLLHLYDRFLKIYAPQSLEGLSVGIRYRVVADVIRRN
jgi:hypothetical protein